jgi:hypothetical protein
MGQVLVPTNSEGKILPQFQDNVCAYVNEASAAGETPNVLFCHDVIRHEIVLVTLRVIEPGEELLTYYCDEYPRNYSVNWIQKEPYVSNPLMREAAARGTIELGNQLWTRNPVTDEVIKARQYAIREAEHRELLPLLKSKIINAVLLR